MLADAVLSKDALPSIGEGTPYIALLGRIPTLLPQLEHIAGTSQLNDETGIEGSRHVHRLREITISSMVEALAERRLAMINQSGPTPLPGELMALRPGDQVEIYRRTTKGRPAWVGPATVKATDVEHGKVMVQWQGQHLEIPLGSVRRAMIFATFYFNVASYVFPAQQHSAIQLIRHTLEHIRNRSVLLGWIRRECTWILTKETRSYWEPS